MSQPRDVSGFETVLKTGKVQVPLKPDEGFNVEVEDQSPSPPSEDSKNLDDANDNADIESAALPEKGSKSESRSIICSFLSKFSFGRPWIVILIVGALTFVVGIAVYGAYSSAAGTGNIQQQKSLAAIGGKGGKAEPPFDQLLCNPLQCGQEFTNGEKVTLIEDLKCAENSDPDQVECAIKLVGPKAELDCSKRMIHTATQDNWKYGICLYDGARAKNCYVQQFGLGFSQGSGMYIENGGEVKDSEVMFNNYSGIKVIDSRGQGGSATKISNTYVHDNFGSGILAYGTATADNESSIQFQGVRSNNNGETGMVFTVGEYFTLEVKDSETSNNSRGIYIDGEGSGDNKKVDLEGFTSRYNGGYGIYLDGSYAALDVTVKGVLNIYKNGGNGLDIHDGVVNVVVEKGGYLNACLNHEDINNGGDGTFGGQGT